MFTKGGNYSNNIKIIHQVYYCVVRKVKDAEGGGFQQSEVCDCVVGWGHYLEGGEGCL